MSCYFITLSTCISINYNWTIIYNDGFRSIVGANWQFVFKLPSYGRSFMPSKDRVMLIFSPCHRVPPLYLVLEGALHSCLFDYYCVFYNRVRAIVVIVLFSFVSYNRPQNIPEWRAMKGSRCSRIPTLVELFYLFFRVAFSAWVYTSNMFWFVSIACMRVGNLCSL